MQKNKYKNKQSLSSDMETDFKRTIAFNLGQILFCFGWSFVYLWLNEPIGTWKNTQCSFICWQSLQRNGDPLWLGWMVKQAQVHGQYNNMCTNALDPRHTEGERLMYTGTGSQSDSFLLDEAARMWTHYCPTDICVMQIRACCRACFFSVCHRCAFSLNSGVQFAVLCSPGNGAVTPWKTAITWAYTSSAKIG